MSDPVKHIVALAQMNPIVGDIHANVDKVIALTQQAQKKFQAELLVFP